MLEKILDLVFPKICIGCMKEGDFLCQSCFKKILAKKNKQYCPNCRRPNVIGAFCGDCCSCGFYFDQLLSYGVYKNDLLKNLIIKFKYKFIKELSELLSFLLFKTLTHYKIDFQKMLIVPVPLHKKRLNYRGYNQAGVLAISLMNFLPDLQIAYCLERVSFETQQAKLNKIERKENITNTIAVKKEFFDQLNGRSIILIDDVATTCNTLNECSRVLKKAGAKNVCGLVLARKW